MEKFLPLSVQNFEEMITGNYVYVDKTRYIYEMFRVPQAYYFLSRHRRFGKSLTVSTLKFLFEGGREIFKDLWIGKSDWKWQKYPVIVIDFSEISIANPEKFETGISALLDDLANFNELHLKHSMLKEKFKELIVSLRNKFNQKVVVLVDEYDKPIIEHLGKGEDHLEIAKANRDILKQFFGILKGINVSAALWMVFITGISKFSRVSIFSDLNNLNDLTMQDSFSALLGYTDEELHQYFNGYVKSVADVLGVNNLEIYEKIHNWYNSYRFTDIDIRVYNPFSVLNLLSNKKFNNYWFETATPSFLVNLIKEKKYPISAIENLNELSFSAYDLDYLELEPLLFQTGYGTIKDVKDYFYRLGYPNQEVKVSFLNYLFNQLIKISSPSIKEEFAYLNQYLEQAQTENFINTVNVILASIPYRGELWIGKWRIFELNYSKTAKTQRRKVKEK